MVVGRGYDVFCSNRENYILAREGESGEGDGRSLELVSENQYGNRGEWMPSVVDRNYGVIRKKLEYDEEIARKRNKVIGFESNRLFVSASSSSEN